MYRYVPVRCTSIHPSIHTYLYQYYLVLCTCTRLQVCTSTLYCSTMYCVHTMYIAVHLITCMMYTCTMYKVALELVLLCMYVLYIVQVLCTWYIGTQYVQNGVIPPCVQVYIYLVYPRTNTYYVHAHTRQVLFTCNMYNVRGTRYIVPRT